MGRQGQLQGLHVVELGAGTGVAGCIAAAFGARRVDFTDADPKVLKALTLHLKAHFRKDGRSGGGGGGDGGGGDDKGRGKGNGLGGVEYHVVPLEWGNVDPAKHVQLAALMGADIVLGADCMYDRDQWDSFLATVYFLLSSKNPRTSGGSGGGNGGGSSGGSACCRFIGCHQLRNSNHSIQPLLEKWGFIAKELLPSATVCAVDFEQRETLGLFELVLGTR